MDYFTSLNLVHCLSESIAKLNNEVKIKYCYLTKKFKKIWHI